MCGSCHNFLGESEKGGKFNLLGFLLIMCFLLLFLGKEACIACIFAVLQCRFCLL